MQLYKYWRKNPPEHWLVRAAVDYQPQEAQQPVTFTDQDSIAKINEGELRFNKRQAPGHFVESSYDSIPSEARQYLESLRKK